MRAVPIMRAGLTGMPDLVNPGSTEPCVIDPYVNGV